jgi:hypothetical protein
MLNPDPTQPFRGGGRSGLRHQNHQAVVKLKKL